MIEASVMRTVWNDGKTGYEVKAKGHAGAGKYGQDIVCAAVSCLMQTLANEVEEAARAGLVALGAVAHGDGWMRVEVTPTRESCNTVEAWVELVQDGLDALAESYPENVELMVNMVFADGKAPDPAELPDMVDGKMNLQYFAEGGGDGGAAGEGGEIGHGAVAEHGAALARRTGEHQKVLPSPFDGAAGRGQKAAGVHRDARLIRIQAQPPAGAGVHERRRGPAVRGAEHIAVVQPPRALALRAALRPAHGARAAVVKLRRRGAQGAGEERFIVEVDLPGAKLKQMAGHAAGEIAAEVEVGVV